MAWPLFSPLISALRQGTGVTVLGDFYKIYMILTICFGCMLFLLKPKLYKFEVSLILTLMLVGISGAIINADLVSERYFSSQFLSFFALIIFIVAFVPKYASIFKDIAGKIVWLNIVWNVLILILFRGGIFGDPGYPNFDVSGLLITFAYSLVCGSHFSLVAHLLIFIFAGKRALLVVAIFLYFAYKTGLLVAAAKYPKVSTLFVIILFIVIGFQFFLIANSGGLDLSSIERLSEIYSAYTQLMTDIYSTILGRGFGWSYHLDGFGFDYEEDELRGYLHSSPAYFHVTFGLFGLLFVCIAIANTIKLFTEGSDDIKIFGVYSLAMIMVGMTRLNYFTEPLFMLAIGMALRSRCLSRLSDFR